MGSEPLSFTAEPCSNPECRWNDRPRRVRLSHLGSGLFNVGAVLCECGWLVEPAPTAGVDGNVAESVETDVAVAMRLLDELEGGRPLPAWLEGLVCAAANGDPVDVRQFPEDVVPEVVRARVQALAGGPQ